MKYVYSDGGRAAAGYKGSTSDCVTRAIAIAADLPYQLVYDELSEAGKAAGRSPRGKPRSHARTGVARTFYEPYLLKHGFRWVSCMTIGSGCKVHLREGELPAKGRIVARLSKHLCAVVDGVIYDTFDPSRDGDRCVYGYFIKE